MLARLPSLPVLAPVRSVGPSPRPSIRTSNYSNLAIHLPIRTHPSHPSLGWIKRAPPQRNAEATARAGGRATSPRAGYRGATIRTRLLSGDDGGIPRISTRPITTTVITFVFGIIAEIKAARTSDVTWVAFALGLRSGRCSAVRSRRYGKRSLIPKRGRALDRGR
jgi:hypothetical protein